MELLAFAMIMVLSVALTLAGTRFVLSALFFYMRQHLNLNGCAVASAASELTYEDLRLVPPRVVLSGVVGPIRSLSCGLSGARR